MSELKIAITKAKGEFVTIDSDKLPDDVFKEALMLGLKTLVNRGTSKITKALYENDEEKLKAAAIAKANEQVELIMTSKIRFTGAKKAKGASGAVMTEARRLAKNLVKDQIKAAGLKISHYEASEITKAANALLESDTGPSIIEQAKANLAERENIKPALDITALIAPSAKKVAAAEAKKAEKKPLSAKQAGKTAPRAKKGKAAAQPAA
jgi:hypothetical protein